MGKKITTLFRRFPENTIAPVYFSHDSQKSRSADREITLIYPVFSCGHTAASAGSLEKRLNENNIFSPRRILITMRSSRNIYAPPPDDNKTRRSRTQRSCYPFRDIAHEILMIFGWACGRERKADRRPKSREVIFFSRRPFRRNAVAICQKRFTNTRACHDKSRIRTSYRRRPLYKSLFSWILLHPKDKYYYRRLRSKRSLFVNDIFEILQKSQEISFPKISTVKGSSDVIFISAKLRF